MNITAEQLINQVVFNGQLSYANNQMIENLSQKVMNLEIIALTLGIAVVLLFAVVVVNNRRLNRKIKELQDGVSAVNNL